MSIFEYTDYKQYISEWVSSRPKQGRGLYSKIASELRTNTVTISQVFRGERQLTPEQGLVLAKFINLNTKETEAFLVMIQIARASTQDLKDYYLQKFNDLKKETQELSKRLDINQPLSNEARAQFYSDWTYSGLRLYCAREDMETFDDIIKAIGLKKQNLQVVLNFLLDNGLVKYQEDGRLTIGMLSTHLESNSPYINNLRRNWRLLALDKTLERNKEDLFYSAPMVISKADIPRIREKLLSFITELTKEISESQCEETACLNIDWFRF
jgi:uncharacterized protein (TIGR02147 family)